MQNIKRFTSLIIMLFVLANAMSQSNKNVIAPLDIPLSISGSFGELRSNAFHMGLDFKTMAMTGFHVFAMDDGYVSRIRIEPGGIGRAIYISHRNGYTSLYGHLEQMRDDISLLVKQEQYRLKQYTVDVFPKANQIPVKKGELIAISGNAGGSAGPHLHFEVRETNSQTPVNITRRFNLGVTDTVAPVIDKVCIYPMDSTSSVNGTNTPAFYTTILTNGIYTIAQTPLSVQGNIGIGILAYDLTNNSTSKTGIYRIELLANNDAVLEQVIDRLSYQEPRYINSLIDYSHYQKTGERVNRLFVEPNNLLSNYRLVKNNGILKVEKGSAIQISIRAADDRMNQTQLSFILKGDDKGMSKPTVLSTSHLIHQKMYYLHTNIFKHDNCIVTIPEKAIYNDFEFEYSKQQQSGFYSYTYSLHNHLTPLHKAMIVQIKPENLPKHLYNKALLANIDQNNHIKWSGGYFKDEYVIANTRYFGNYAVIVDTTPPRLQFINHGLKNNDFTLWSRIAFLATDDISGIDSYKGYIDGQWALFAYDAKEDLLYYEFDPTRMKFGSTHQLELHVTDEKGNKAEYHTTFFK